MLINSIYLFVDPYIYLYSIYMVVAGPEYAR